MIVQELKKRIYQILSSDLKYNIKDSSSDSDVFPSLKLQLLGCMRDRYRNVFVNNIKFQIDIFSEYDGEKEILEIEEAIFNKMREVYDIPGVVYIQESDFRILDDKSLGYTLKHGIISYAFYTGGEEIIEEEVEDEQTSPTP